MQIVVHRDEVMLRLPWLKPSLKTSFHDPDVFPDAVPDECFGESVDGSCELTHYRHSYRWWHNERMADGAIALRNLENTRLLEELRGGPENSMRPKGLLDIAFEIELWDIDFDPTKHDEYFTLTT